MAKGLGLHNHRTSYNKIPLLLLLLPRAGKKLISSKFPTESELKELEENFDSKEVDSTSSSSVESSESHALLKR